MLMLYIWMLIVVMLLDFSIYWFVLKATPHKRPVITNWPSVTVVVPMYNDGSTVSNTLSSICGQSYAGLINVVLIDDGSTDNTYSEIEKWVSGYTGDIDIQVRRNTPNTGCKALAISAHLNLITGEYVVPIDGDGMLDPMAITTLVEYAIAGGPDVTAVSGAVRCSPQTKFSSIMQECDFHYNYSLHKIAESQLKSVTTCSGALALLRTKEFVETGGFRGDVLVEDIVYSCAQLFKYGNSTLFCKDAIVWTAPQPTMKKLFLQRKRWAFGIWEAIDRGSIRLTDKFWANKTLPQQMLCLGELFQNTIGSYILFFMMWILAIPTNGISILIAIVARVVSVSLLVWFSDRTLVGVPKLRNGNHIEMKHSFFTKVVALCAMIWLLRISTLSTNIHQLTNQKKTWFTR